MSTTGKVENGEDRESERSGAKTANFFIFPANLSFRTRLDFFLIGVCGLTAAMPLMFLVFGRPVNNLVGYFVAGTTVSQADFQRAVNHNTLYLVYIFIGKWLLGYISVLCIRISGMRISSALRLAYIQALFAQPISSIDKVSPGKVSSRITTSANTIKLGISQQFSLLIQVATFTIGAYVVAFLHNVLVTLVASVCIPFVLLVLGTTIFLSVWIVVAFGAEERLHARYASLIDRAAQNQEKCGPLMGMMMWPVYFSTYATMALVFWFGIRQYIHHDLSSMGSIVVVLFSVIMAVSQISRIWSPITVMAKAATVSTELFKTIDAEVLDTSGLKSPNIQASAKIDFHNVSFAYPSRPNVQVLQNLTTTFQAGKITAIVGPSGSGKSTIVGLIDRWYDIRQSSGSRLSRDNGDGEMHTHAEKADNPVLDDEGAIKIGNTNLNEINAKWWRTQIGLVQQEPFLFNDTILKNVAYGLCGTEWQDSSDVEKLEMAKAACKESYVDEFVSRLPQGYNTVVGESGIKLSGGQRQRLAIARAIIKKPSVLILDEATSAIDVRTERIVQAALDCVAQYRTTIVIAHRLATIKKADKIIVLCQGKVVEEGTHEKLLQNHDGVYHGLINAQALTMGKHEIDGEDTLATDLASSRAAETNIVLPSDPRAEMNVKEKHRLLYEQRMHWFLYTMVIIGATGGGIMYPIQAYIFGKLIYAFTLTGQALVNTGNHWSLMFFIQAIGVGIASFMLGRASLLVAVAVSTYHRKEYLEHMLDKKIAFFDGEGNSPGTLTSRLSDDPHRVEALIGTEMSMGLIAFVNLLGSTIISFIYGWKFSLVGIFAIMPVILTAGFFGIKLELEFEELNAAVFAESSQFATEAISAFRTVTSLMMEELVVERYASLLQTHVVNASKKALLSTVVFATSDSVELLCQALVFWYGGRLIASHEYDITSYFVIYMAVIFGSQAAGMFFSFSPNIAEAVAASNRIMSLRPSTAVGNKAAIEFKAKDGNVGVEFRDVNFAYKSRMVQVLSGVNLKIRPGQFAALLARKFYDPDSGTILCGEQDITAGDKKTYRDLLSLVAQESTLYEGTVKENVALSVGEAEVTDEAVEEACRQAQIHDFIMSLPEAYAMKDGSKAVQLSGGQRQRLALARALLRKPRLLLLDEATSSLDSESEKLVQEAIERAAGAEGRTVVAVAHRLATIQNVDIIFVIGSGTILEQGNHQELLKKREVYYQMCQLQVLGL
ncbi:leptomycin B resistance protein pmd1 [Stipitochalara longipes BDJ]|nr:leptomycin B resistance protein pmd1 [Stipitochalara longipes BDJ]